MDYESKFFMLSSIEILNWKMYILGFWIMECYINIFFLLLGLDV